MDKLDKIGHLISIAGKIISHKAHFFDYLYLFHLLKHGG